MRTFVFAKNDTICLLIAQVNTLIFDEPGALLDHYCSFLLHFYFSQRQGIFHLIGILSQTGVFLNFPAIISLLLDRSLSYSRIGFSLCVSLFYPKLFRYLRNISVFTPFFLLLYIFFLNGQMIKPLTFVFE